MFETDNAVIVFSIFEMGITNGILSISPFWILTVGFKQSAI